MAGHVPHVSDPRCTRAALGCGSEGQFLLAVIPQVDSEMVCRMPRIASKNIIEHRVHCRVTLDVVPLALILPNLQHEHGFELDLLWVILDDLIELAGVTFETLFAFVSDFVGDVGFLFTPFGLGLGWVLLVFLFLFLFRWLGPVFDPSAPGLDEPPFQGARLFDPLHGLFDEPGGSLGILGVGPSHPPVENGSVGFDRGSLAERSLGFEVPKAMQLRDPLIEKPLGHRVFGGDFPVDVPHALHQISRLAGALIKGLCMERVAGILVLGRIFLVLGPPGDGQCDQTTRCKSAREKLE